MGRRQRWARVSPLSYSFISLPHTARAPLCVHALDASVARLASSATLQPCSFFIYIGKGDATHWAHDHTVFAEVADAPSWHTIEELGKLPVKTGGMTFFEDKIKLKVAKPAA